MFISIEFIWSHPIFLWVRHFVIVPVRNFLVGGRQFLLMRLELFPCLLISYLIAGRTDHRSWSLWKWIPRIVNWKLKSSPQVISIDSNFLLSLVTISIMDTISSWCSTVNQNSCRVVALIPLGCRVRPRGQKNKM